jgi:hypothetical protein
VGNGTIGMSKRATAKRSKSKLQTLSPVQLASKKHAKICKVRVIYNLLFEGVKTGIGLKKETASLTKRFLDWNQLRA